MPQLSNQPKAQPEVLDLEERTWLAAHLRGDQQAFGKLMQAYRKPLYSFLFRYGLDADNRDDVFQEVFLKIHRSAHLYQPSRPLSPWIFTIAINTLRDLQRKKQLHTADLDVAAVIEDEQPTPDKSAQLNETMDWLEQAVTALPQSQAEAFTLSMVKGMKIKEVGETLDLPLNTIKSQIRRAKQNLLSAFQARQTKQQAHPGQSGVTHE